MKTTTHDWEGRFDVMPLFYRIADSAPVTATDLDPTMIRNIKAFIQTEIEAAEKRAEASQKELLESLVLMYEQYCHDGHAFMTAGETASSTLENYGYSFDEVGRIIATPTKDKGEDVSSKQ